MPKCCDCLSLQWISQPSYTDTRRYPAYGWCWARDDEATADMDVDEIARERECEEFEERR
jgi:hypothetical protein